MSVLRPMGHGDLDSLLEVQREGAVAGLGHIFPQDEFPFPVGEVRARWSVELDDLETRCWVIVQDRRLAGFAAARQNEFLHFGTAVSTWGSGLAARAHDEVLGHIGRQGYPLAVLRVFAENRRAIRFYERRGWSATARTTRTTFPPHPVLRHYEIALD